jgi:hypothetical protein
MRRCRTYCRLMTANVRDASVPRTLPERVIYWISTVLTLLFLVYFGIQDLQRSPAVITAIQHLGYPWYFSDLLGVGKLLAAAVLIYPKTRLLREWAYAGISIELISSFVSHSFLADPWPLRIAPLVILTIVAIAFRFDPYRAQRS